jgi:adenosylcobinamide-phosphate synthase
MDAALALVALLIEAIVGYPDRLLRAIGHPVIWMGGLIARLDRALNRPGPSCAVFARALAPSLTLPRERGRERSGAAAEGELDCRVKPGNDDVSGTTSRIPGVLALLILLAAVGAAALTVERALLLLPFGFVGVGLAASTLIAQRSLHNHVARVASALETGSLAAGREAVSNIVGRDTDALDLAGVSRAAVESLAENFSDGVVAPAFWLALGGLTGGALYKAVNTADSTIGHCTPRYAQFGWAAARLDDLVNLPASRLSALLIMAAAAMTSGASAADAWRAIRRDAPRHRSPNAGYPEAAMAGALGLSLAGPRVYGGALVDDACMGCGRREANAADIRAALALYRRADGLLIALVAILVAALSALG